MANSTFDGAMVIAQCTATDRRAEDLAVLIPGAFTGAADDIAVLVLDAVGQCCRWCGEQGKKEEGAFLSHAVIPNVGFY
ncbi:MAG: hypothetical protein OQK40_04915 [Gammaproteobacteria bacterium]|nr:hypothetical protein [Gammaproteobacteria bacterium]